jgi:hypothetical protein
LGIALHEPLEWHMKNAKQRLPKKRYRPFAQEMQEAYFEWVKTLPFIKDGIQDESERIQEVIHAR